jgi:hypothetical protein
MASVLVSLVVTFLFLVGAGVIGHRLGKQPRPYGFLNPAAHIALFALVLSGVVATIYKLRLLPDHGSLRARVFLYLAALALAVNLVVGAWMLFIKGKSRMLRTIHKVSTYVMAGSIVAGTGFVTAAI